MPQLGVDGIGKINRRGAGGQFDNIRIGRKDKHTIAEDIGLHAGHEIIRVIRRQWLLHQLAQVGDFFLHIFAVGRLFFILPMRGNT